MIHQSTFFLFICGLGATLLVSAALILTERWHGRLSMDGLHGVQKVHTRPTPRIGGIAIICGLFFIEFLAPSDIRPILTPIVIAGIPAFIAGLIEDLTKKVGVRSRLIATMLSGAVAWFITGISMQNTGLWGLDHLLLFTPLAVAFTAFSVGGIANSINIIDGFNGLAAGAVAIMLGTMGIIATEVGDTNLAAVCFSTAGIALGFGLVNWPFGKIFLGDGGAYLLGFILGWIAVLLPMRNPTNITGWTSLLVCAYPVIEVGFSYLRRTKRQTETTQPDKVHFHQLIHRRMVKIRIPGKSPSLQNGLTSPFCWLFTTIPCTWAIVFYKTPIILFIGFIFSIFIYSKFYRRLSNFKWN